MAKTDCSSGAATILLRIQEARVVFCRPRPNAAYAADRNWYAPIARPTVLVLGHAAMADFRTALHPGVHMDVSRTGKYEGMIVAEAVAWGETADQYVGVFGGPPT